MFSFTSTHILAKEMHKVKADKSSILDMANDGRVVLFEADGGMWKMDAKKEIAEYFEKALNGLISDGHVVVMM